MKRQNYSSNSQQVAWWRYQKIEPALEHSLSATERGRILRQLSAAAVIWPNGKRKKLSLATLYRWIDRFWQGGVQALRPARRKDRGCQRQRLPVQVVQEALRLLAADPTMTLTFLLAVLRVQFDPSVVHITRSTLARRLAAEPTYTRIKRAAQYTRPRTRFVAKSPHDIWQMDAKGPVHIRLVSGSDLRFHLLSIIDDATRYVLSALIVLSVDLAAAVRVFRLAALRWGLPNSLYADKASIFDSHAFRMGLGQLGAYRIPTRARNAPARGKIEAYHRTVAKWFFHRLPSQPVVDLVHLQQLVDAVIGSIYHPHKHRSLGCSPEQALSGAVSPRSVPASRLIDAFRQEKTLKAHPKTGEVVIDQVTYLVADELRGQRLSFLVDPAAEVPPLVVHPHSEQKLSVRRATIRAADIALDDSHDKFDIQSRWAPGPLQAIYDHLCGTRRPLSEPGFGLPEIYQLLSHLSGRHVPATDAEAALIQDIYRQSGPFTKTATEQAFSAIGNELGPARPIKTYLDALMRRVKNHPQNH
jgi:transposase InsO family protein